MNVPGRCVIVISFYVITVPAPDVVVTATYTTPLYVGSSFTLTCAVTLNPHGVVQVILVEADTTSIILIEHILAVSPSIL